MENLILVAQGDPDDRALILRAIGDADVRVETTVVRDGEEALNYLLARGAYAGRDVRIQPRLVLLDSTLPRLGGLEVLRRLRQDERTRLLRVVVISSSDQPRDVGEAYRTGANSYIHKPVDPARFAEVMRHTVMFWLTVNEPLPEGWTRRCSGGKTFRAAWFRARLINRRKHRRTAVLVGVSALLAVYLRGRRR